MRVGSVSRCMKLLFLSLSFILILTFQIPFSDNSYADDSLYGCSCDGKIGTRGTCSTGQSCHVRLSGGEGSYCHANSAGGFPLRSCGEGCTCRTDDDCGRIAFAGKCIANHCYSRVNGMFVTPLACAQTNARKQTNN